MLDDDVFTVPDQTIAAQRRKVLPIGPAHGLHGLAGGDWLSLGFPENGTMSGPPMVVSWCINPMNTRYL